MIKNYLNVNYDGSIFQYSKDEQEGFVKHTSSTGKVSYRKYYNKGVEGKLLWVNRKNNPNLHNREEIEIVLGADNDQTYYLNFVVYGQDSSLDTYTEQLVRYLPKLEKGTVYNINNWFMKAGDIINGQTVDRNVKGLTIKVANTKIEPSLSYQSDENPDGDIPKLMWKEKNGKKLPTASSKEERSDFLYEVLLKESDRLAFSNSNEEKEQPAPKKEGKNPKNSVPTATPSEAFEPATNFNDEEYDDLPF